MRIGPSPFSPATARTGDKLEDKTRRLRRADRDLHVSAFVEGEVRAHAVGVQNAEPPVFGFLRIVVDLDEVG